MINETEGFQVCPRDHLPGFAEQKCTLSNSSRTQSLMIWIRCSNLLNKVHLLLISCSTFDRCSRWMFRSSWLTIIVNQAHKQGQILPTVLWIVAQKSERSRCICNVLRCFSSVSGVCHHQLLSDDCIFFFFRLCLFLQESSDSLDHTLLYLLSEADTSTR